MHTMKKRLLVKTIACTILLQLSLIDAVVLNPHDAQEFYYDESLAGVIRQSISQDCSCESGTRTRREAGSMSEAEWESFVRAFTALKDTNDGLSTFERFVEQHRRSASQAHRGAQFLPWHREYLFQVECRMRRINPSVALPYWDWSADSADLALSPVWSRIGGAARNRPIPNAPFRGWNSSVTRQHLIVRGFDSNRAGSITVPVENAATIRRLQNDGSLPFGRFSGTLEVYHNAPHVAVGGSVGDMSSVATSPNDPIFFLHHAFIDKIWSEWQRNPGRGRDYGGTHSGRRVSLTDRIQPWNGTVSDFFARDQCVTYQQTARGGTRGRAVSPRLTASEAGKANPRKTALVKKVYARANAMEKRKLDEASDKNVAAIARRFEKNQWYRDWARKNNFPMDKVLSAEKVSAKEDPSVEFSKVEDGVPPGT